jgi:hypothetical protein
MEMIEAKLSKSELLRANIKLTLTKLSLDLQRLVPLQAGNLLQKPIY